MARGLSDINLIPNFLITINNAYFQTDDFSTFSGISQRTGEIFESLFKSDYSYAYIPLLTMLVLIETLGALLTDKNGIKNNMSAFIEKYMPNYIPHVDGLYNLRNTMAHDWQGSKRILLMNNYPTTGHMEIINEDEFVINLKQLYYDLKNGFDSLTTASENESELFWSMTMRLKTKYENSEKKAK